MKLTWTLATPGSARIATAGGKTLAVYKFAGVWHPYFHPIYTHANDGCLTCEAPFDHRWHHGLWWTWKRINGVVFWEDIDDNHGRTVSRACEGQEQADGTVRIEQKIDYIAPAASKTDDVWMREDRTIVAHPAAPGAAALADGWALDWHLRFRAERQCVCDVYPPITEQRWGGYMGLNFRPTRSMAWEEQILTSEGGEGGEWDQKQFDSPHGKPAKWAAYSGLLDGAGTVRPVHAGVAVLDHPTNPRHPAPRYLWSAGPDKSSFGFLGTSPLMHQPLTLEAGERVEWRFRVLFFSGPAKEARPHIDEAWQHFAAK
jgi:hypothetical protein